MLSAIIQALISVFLIIGGLSGEMVLRGTNSSSALVIVGCLWLVYDIYNIIKVAKTPKIPPVMYCVRCGKKLETNETVCSDCGEPKFATAEAQKPAPALKTEAQPSAVNESPKKAPLLFIVLCLMWMALLAINTAVGRNMYMCSDAYSLLGNAIFGVSLYLMTQKGAYSKVFSVVGVVVAAFIHACNTVMLQNYSVPDTTPISSVVNAFSNPIASIILLRNLIYMGVGIIAALIAGSVKKDKKDTAIWAGAIAETIAVLVRTALSAIQARGMQSPAYFIDAVFSQLVAMVVIYVAAKITQFYCTGGKKLPLNKQGKTWAIILSLAGLLLGAFMLYAGLMGKSLNGFFNSYILFFLITFACCLMTLCKSKHGCVITMLVSVVVLCGQFSQCMGGLFNGVFGNYILQLLITIGLGAVMYLGSMTWIKEFKNNL